MQKPGIPKGTRDFSPEEMLRRNHIFDTIKDVFVKYRYHQIETPSMENLSTLLGKYGEEGDKLLFKILNSGDFLSKVKDENAFTDSTILSTKICEKGLRYDLTVPFARYVVQHRNDITFPFKRYQIQPVWRADRPQKGRYREFYQCDVDVIGSNSLLNEVELIQIIDEVFTKLNVNVTTKLNNRKLLAGIAEIIGEEDKFMDITIAIDKLDKIGPDGVKKELIAKGIAEAAIDKLDPILDFSGSNKEKLEKLSAVLQNSETGMKGIAEMNEIMEYLELASLNSAVEIDLTLARGLNYYTGAIFEVKANDVEIGSICGGGRYDDLTGIFGLPDVSGVGISFGADRIYDVMLSLNSFQTLGSSKNDVMFVNFGNEECKAILPIIEKLRKGDVQVELFPDNVKMKKQMSYANNTKVKFVALMGANEIANNVVKMKNMEDGTQEEVKVEKLVDFLRK